MAEREECVWFTEDECKTMISQALASISIAGAQGPVESDFELRMIELNAAIAHKLFTVSELFTNKGKTKRMLGVSDWLISLCLQKGQLLY